MSNEIQKKENIAVAVPKNIADQVLGRVSDMTTKNELFMPADYSPENALKSAWLTLQEVEDRNHNKALEVCSKASICNALLDMVVQGLSPAKKQCYFIVYGKEMTLMRSYMGTVAVAKRFSNVKDVYSNCIFADDVFEFEIDPATGLKRVIKHTTSLDNIDIAKIKGAYAVVVREDAENYVEIMTMEQIRKAWAQGATKGDNPAHKNFTEEMAKKTVINRACKMFVNTSSDEPVLVETFNRSTEVDYQGADRTYYDSESDVVVDVADEEITTEASKAIFGDIDKTPFDEPGEGVMVADSDAGDEEVGESDAADQG